MLFVGTYASQIAAPPVAVGPWTPAALGTTVKAWCRFDEITAPAGSQITSFTDAQGTTYTGNPFVREGFLAPGKKSIQRKDGVGELTGSINMPMLGTAPRTIFIVFSLYEPGHNTNIAGIGGQPAGRQALDLWVQGGTWAWHLNGPAVANGGAMGRDLPTVAAFATSNGYRHELWQNGNTRGIFTDDYPMVTSNGPLRLLYGVHGGLPYGNTSIDIGEIVVCDSYLTTEQCQKMEGYLAWKWSRVGQLPADHPYKSAAPTA